MDTPISAITGGMSNFSRSYSSAARSFAGLAQGPDGLRGVPQISDSSAPGNQNNVDLAQQQPEDFVPAAVGLIEASVQVKSEGAVLRRGNDMLGSLLDMLA